MPIANIVIIQKFEIWGELPKCDIDTSKCCGEKMVLIDFLHTGLLRTFNLQINMIFEVKYSNAQNNKVV